jgi:hemerythrin-like domain-containing protein
MNQTAPIKRSLELQTLSREHHSGLLFVWKLREGLKKGTSSERLTDYVSWYWRTHMRRHLSKEEKIILPLMPKNSLAEKVEVEHNYIKEILHDIYTDPLREDFARLADVIERHIRFEERELFQYLQDHLSKDHLALIQTATTNDLCDCDEWKDAFWSEIK